MRSEAYMYMGQWTGLWLAHVTTWIPLCAKSLSGVPDYFYRNKISSGGDLSYYSSASLY